MSCVLCPGNRRLRRKARVGRWAVVFAVSSLVPCSSRSFFSFFPPFLFLLCVVVVVVVVAAAAAVAAAAVDVETDLLENKQSRP